MSKLTLSIDDKIIAAAKQHAGKRGVSVSKIVEDYLAAVSHSAYSGSSDAPILRSLRGVLRNGDIGAYRKHLATKYR